MHELGLFAQIISAVPKVGIIAKDPGHKVVDSKVNILTNINAIPKYSSFLAFATEVFIGHKKTNPPSSISHALVGNK